jgi:hypothetical protein
MTEADKGECEIGEESSGEGEIEGRILSELPGVVLDLIEEGGENAYWNLRMNSKQLKSK